MNYKLLKTKEDFELYTENHKYAYISSPKEYPAIILEVQEDPSITWDRDSIKLNRRHSFEYIYPAQIQKELYRDDFDNLVNKP